MSKTGISGNPSTNTGISGYMEPYTNPSDVGTIDFSPYIDELNSVGHSLTDMMQRAMSGGMTDQEQADYEKNKYLIKLDQPTPYDLEKDNPIASVLSYMPFVNPAAPSNISNAIQTWIDPTYKPALPINPMLPQMMENSINKNIDEYKYVQDLAQKSPEDRSVADIATISKYLKDNIDQGKLKNASELLSYMPENFESAPADIKVAQIENKADWWEKTYADNKPVFDYMKQKQLGQMGAISSYLEDKKQDMAYSPDDNLYHQINKSLGRGLVSTAQGVLEPFEQTSMAIEKHPWGVNKLSDVGTGLASLINTFFATGMTPLNALTGAMQDTYAKNFYNGSNELAMQMLSSPGELVKYGAALGIKDPEALANISTITNGLVLGLGGIIRGKIANKAAEVEKQYSSQYPDKLPNKTLEQEAEQTQQMKEEQAKKVQEAFGIKTEQPQPAEPNKPIDAVNLTPESKGPNTEASKIPPELVAKYRQLNDETDYLIHKNEMFYEADPQTAATYEANLKNSGIDKDTYLKSKLKEYIDLEKQIKGYGVDPDAVLKSEPEPVVEPETVSPVAEKPPAIDKSVLHNDLINQYDKDAKEIKAEMVARQNGLKTEDTRFDGKGDTQIMEELKKTLDKKESVIKERDEYLTENNKQPEITINPPEETPPNIQNNEEFKAEESNPEMKRDERFKQPEVQEDVRTNRIVQNVDPNDLSVDPDRFQMRKMTSVKEKATGDTGRLADVKTWDDDAKGIVNVWKDPEDGKTYIVNGHHRYAKAKELGEKLDIRYIDAPDAETAKSVGAKINIAEGNASSIEAADFFRQEGIQTPQDVEDSGLTMKKDIVNNGLGLARLDKPLYNMVGKDNGITINQGAIIGNNIEDGMKQRVAYDWLQKQPNTNNVSLDKLRTVIDKINDTMTDATQSEGSLFGETVADTKLFDKTVDLETDVRKHFEDQAKSARILASEDKGNRVVEGGFAKDVDVEASKNALNRNKQMMEVFDKTKNNELRGLIKDQANKVLGGEKYGKVLDDTIQQVTEKLNEHPLIKGTEGGIGKERAGVSGEELFARTEGKNDVPTRQKEIDTENKPRPFEQLSKEEFKPKVPLDKLEEGDAFFDKNERHWTVSRDSEGNLIRYDGRDENGDLIMKAIGTGEKEDVVGLNSQEASFSGSLSSDQIAEKYRKEGKEGLNYKGNVTGEKVDPTIKNKEVDQSLKDAQTAKDDTTMLSRLRDKLVEIKRFCRQHFPEFNLKDAGQRYAANAMRVWESAKDRSLARTLRNLKAIMAPIRNVTGAYELFNKKVLIDDIYKDYENGLYDIGANPNQSNPIVQGTKEIPFFKTVDELQKAKAEIDAKVDLSPSVQKALKVREDIMSALRTDAVAKGVLGKKALDDPRYFHHQVIEYQVANNLAAGQNPFGASRYNKERVGSSKEYYTDYLMSEGEVMYQMYHDMETKTCVEKILKSNDIIKEVLKKSASENLNYMDIVKRDYPNHVKLDLDPASKLYGGMSRADRLVKAITGWDEVAHIVPKEVAAALNGFKWRDTDWVSKAAKQLDKAWKFDVLFMPTRAMKYMFNNGIGDADFAFAAYPGVFSPKLLTRSIHELWDSARGHNTQDIQDWIDNAGGDAGISAQELPSMLKNESSILATFSNGKRAYRALMDLASGKDVKMINSFRENILRYAMYLHVKDKILKGENPYGVSNPQLVDYMKDPVEKAALISREILGDYGNRSALVSKLRVGIAPFLSWLEIDAPRYVSLLRNTKYEGGAGTVAGRTGMTALMFGKNVAGALIKMNAFYGLMQFYNNLLHPEETKELEKMYGTKANLILGRNPDGSILAIKMQTAWADALDWFDMSNYYGKIASLVNGETTSKEVLNQTLKAAPNKIWQAILPIPKAGVEYLSGKTSYPDAFNWTPIVDRNQYLAKVISLEPVYRYLAGKPMRDYKTELLGATMFYNVPIQESAYNYIRGKEYDWMDEHGLGSGRSDKLSAKQEALYYYKVALKYGDVDAQKSYKNQYYDLGGTWHGLKKSVDMVAPLKIVGRRNESNFLGSLSEGDRQMLKYAQEYYDNLYANE